TERAAHEVDFAGHARRLGRPLQRHVGLPFGFEPHAAHIDLVWRAQADVETDEIKETAADRREPLAADTLASCRGLAADAGEHRDLRCALANDPVARFGKPEAP